jgi:hypothetical protein
MTQLQPVPDNSNALNIKEGNPDLKQEYTHTIQSRLNLISPYKNKNLFLFMNIQMTGNKIVNSDSINLQTGVRRTKPINVNGVYNLNTEINYSMPARFLKGSVEIGANTRIFKTKQFINSIGNDIKTTTLGPDIRIDMNPTDKINVSLGAGVNYNSTKYSLQESLNTDYLSQDYSAAVDWELPKRFFLSTDFMYTINSQRATGFNTKVPLWNASISKQMLKFNRGELKFSARDLLNRNVGISRNTNNNYIEDSRVLILRQFFLLSFTYSLSKVGLTEDIHGGGGGMRIISR